MTNSNTNVYLQKQIESASRVEQVVMLYDGAIRFYLKAKQAIEQGKVEDRFNYNRRATDIITYLLDTLDVEQGGEVAERLSRIYTFILTRQMQIDLKNDTAAVDEIVGHLKALRKAWEDIARKGAAAASAEAAGQKPEGHSEEEKKADPKGPRSAIA